jgi:hypothetical protein
MSSIQALASFVRITNVCTRCELEVQTRDKELSILTCRAGGPLSLTRKQCGCDVHETRGNPVSGPQFCQPLVGRFPDDFHAQPISSVSRMTCRLLLTERKYWLSETRVGVLTKDKCSFHRREIFLPTATTFPDQHW